MIFFDRIRMKYYNQMKEQQRENEITARVVANLL